MWKVKVSYSVTLVYPSLADAERAIEVLFEGGVVEVELSFEAIEEAAA